MGYSTRVSNSPFTEIEYRSRWLLEQLRDGERVSREVLVEELEGIRAAVERTKAEDAAIADRLTQAVDRANALLGGRSEQPLGKGRHLPLVQD